MSWRDITLHLSGIPSFDPVQSYAGAIVVMPELDEVCEIFRDGLRAAYGKVPIAGIPRLLRIRRKAGAGTGFSGWGALATRARGPLPSLSASHRWT